MTPKKKHTHMVEKAVPKKRLRNYSRGVEAGKIPARSSTTIREEEAIESRILRFGREGGAVAGDKAFQMIVTRHELLKQSDAQLLDGRGHRRASTEDEHGMNDRFGMRFD
jgi:hypothetical protein